MRDRVEKSPVVLSCVVSFEVARVLILPSVQFLAGQGVIRVQTKVSSI